MRSLLISLTLTGCTALPAAPTDAALPDDGPGDGAAAMAVTAAERALRSAPQEPIPDEVHPHVDVQLQSPVVDPVVIDVDPDVDAPIPVREGKPSLLVQRYTTSESFSGFEYDPAEPRGFPAISADGRTLIWIDGDGDFSTEQLVIADARTGRVRSRRGFPYDSSSASFQRLARRLDRGDYRTLRALARDEELSSEALETRFVGDGYDVVQTAERGDIQLRDGEDVVATRRGGMARGEDGDPRREELFGAWAAPDDRFVVVVSGACVCWCDIEPNHRVLFR